MTTSPQFKLAPVQSPSRFYVGTSVTDLSRDFSTYPVAEAHRARLQDEVDTTYRLAHVNGQEGMPRNIYRVFVDTSVPTIRECLPVS